MPRNRERRKEDNMRQKQRKLHGLPYTEIVKLGNVSSSLKKITLGVGKVPKSAQPPILSYYYLAQGGDKVEL